MPRRVGGLADLFGRPDSVACGAGVVFWAGCRRGLPLCGGVAIEVSGSSTIAALHLLAATRSALLPS